MSKRDVGRMMHAYLPTDLPMYLPSLCPQIKQFPSDGSSPHDKFSASKALFYSLVRLNTLLPFSTKEELLPLEALLVQVGR